MLSREYNYSVLKPNQTISQGNQILQQASTDYYSKSFSRDSLDGTSSILHSSSCRLCVLNLLLVDCYYVTQEVSVPQESLGNPNIVIKVLTPLKNGMSTQREEEEKNRETAVLFQNGVKTNLIGRECISTALFLELVRISRVFLVMILQSGVWCCFEYVQSVIQAQYSILTETTAPSASLLLTFELFYPIISLIIALTLVIFTRTLQLTARYKITSLQLIGCGISVYLSYSIYCSLFYSP